MRVLVFAGLAALLATLSLSGCIKDSAQTSSKNDNPQAPAAAEAEVKPKPVDAPLAAAPPAVPEPGAAASPAPSQRPASPEEQTKETLDSKPAPAAAAALASAKAEPAAALPQIAAAAPAPDAATAKAGQSAAQRPAGNTLAVVGDSLAVGVGMTMEQRVKDMEGMACRAVGKVSTGLINKKSLDWEKKLAELVAKEKLAAVVVVMGGNDANNSIAGKAPGTPEWSEAYRQKAEHFIRIAADGGVATLWVGLPVMRDAAYSQRVQAVNAAAREACAKVPGCSYMDAPGVFADASGNFLQARDIDGKNVSLRAKDGVHMTMTGYDLLCRQVIDDLAQKGTLPAKAR